MTKSLLDPDTPVTVTLGPGMDCADVVYCTWGDFCDANPEDSADVEIVLLHGEVYWGGGGAVPEYSVMLVSEEER